MSNWGDVPLDADIATRMGTEGVGGAGGWTTVSKSADEARTNANLAADATLKFAMLANTKYRFRLNVFYTTAATPDFKYRTAGPASPTLVAINRQHTLPGTTTIVTAVDTAYSAADVPMAGNAGTGMVFIEGVIHNGANAGDFEFRWAQNTANASAATVLAGSYIEYKVA